MEPDASNHFKRAFQISRGELVGKKISPVSSGGESIASLDDDASAYYYGFFDRRWKAPSGANLNGREDKIVGPTKYSAFPNTVIYEPILYAPDVIAIKISRIFDFSIMQTLHSMRILTAMASLMITLFALLIVPLNRRFLLLFVVSIPQVMLSYASISYDAVFIAFCALASAALCRAYDAETPEKQRASLILFFAVASVIVASKPPYVSILLFPVLATPNLFFPFRKLSLWTAISLLPTIFWTIIGIHPISTPAWVGRSDVAGQLAYLFHHPLKIFSIAYLTVTRHGAPLLAQSIGTIRWSGPWLPKPYYVFVAVIFAALLMAFIASVVKSRSKKFPPILIFLNFPLCAFLISLSIYLTWDAVGDPDIWGINGRYFTALMMFIPAMFFIPKDASVHYERAEKLVTCVFLPISLLITLHTLVFLNFDLPI